MLEDSDGGPATFVGFPFFYGMSVDSLGTNLFTDSKTTQLIQQELLANYYSRGTIGNTGNSGSALSVDLDGMGCPYDDTGSIYLTSYQYFLWYCNCAFGQ